MAAHDEFPMLPADNAPPEPVPPPPRKKRTDEAALPTGAPPPRQTLSFLNRLFEAHGLELKSKLGQNYLVDLNLIDLIIRSAELGPNDCVLEVGTGTGSLTAKLAEKAGSVVTIEIDRTFHPVAKEVVGPRPNVTFLLGDCLEKKNELSRDMLFAWDAAAKSHPTRKLVANLPYVIATPLISNLLISDIPVERMVVMVQWEIAERMRALPGTKDYNALSVLIQSVADVETMRKVLPANFYPRPKVDSAIVMIKPNAAKRAAVGDVRRFRNFLRDLYTHRRKNLRQGLSGWPSGRRDKVDIDAKLAELGIDGTIRAEALDLEQHLKLCQVFGE